ncbi:MAG: Flagellar hook-associated protein 2 [Pelotomaculum sp. PtaB.Bin104]|nr:MAG: Flagellar hook-associated protein 2 [Pelotomaculum sp. PtaB.Bin104]
MTTNVNRVTGLASGMDIDTIVANIMKAKKVPLDRINRNYQTLVWQKDAYRDINTKLLALKDTVTPLKLESTIAAKTTTSSNNSVVTATATADAVNSTFTVNVTNLATHTVKQSTAAVASDPTGQPISLTDTIASQTSKFVTAPTGTDIKFTINGKPFNFTTSNTLQEIMDTVNSTSDAGVYMVFDEVNQKMVVTSTATGTSAAVTLADTTGNFLTGTMNVNSTVQTGTNATVTINGATINQTSNTFTVNNVTFTLAGLTGTQATVTVANDVDKAYDAIKAFVDKYNETIASFNTAYNEEKDSDYYPLTDAEKKEMSETEITNWEKKAKEGILEFDSILGSTINKMRTNLSSVIADYSVADESVTVAGAPAVASLDHGNLTTGVNTKITAEVYDGSKWSYQRFTVITSGRDPVNPGEVKLDTETGALTFFTGVYGSHTYTAADYYGVAASYKYNDSTYKNLASIGITTGSYLENGKLYIDENKLKAALTSNADDIYKLFAQDFTMPSGLTTAQQVAWKEANVPKQGLFQRLGDIIANSISQITSKAGDTSAADNSTIGKQMQQLNEDYDELQDRLDDYEDNLYKQFSNMESYINDMNTIASKFQQQLAKLG